MPAKAFRIKRQTKDGETLHQPTYSCCPACYRPTTRSDYCSPTCEHAHKRLRGTAT